MVQMSALGPMWISGDTPEVQALGIVCAGAVQREELQRTGAVWAALSEPPCTPGLPAALARSRTAPALLGLGLPQVPSWHRLCQHQELVPAQEHLSTSRLLALVKQKRVNSPSVLLQKREDGNVSYCAIFKSFKKCIANRRTA